MIHNLSIGACLKLFTDEQKREMKQILNSIYKSVTIHEFNIHHEDRTSYYHFICHYNYKTYEELGKKMVNNAEHYYEYTGFFQDNKPLYDLWKKYEFEDKEVQEYIGNIFSYGYIEMDIVKKIYEEIGYDEFVNHLDMINKVDQYEHLPCRSNRCFDNMCECYYDLKRFYVIEFSDSPPSETVPKN